MQNFGWIFPAAVEVLTTQCTSIVTINDSICVEHWNYFEYEVISQCLGFGCIADQEIYNAFHYPTCITFTRMHSCTDKDSLFSFCFLVIWILVLRCDSQIFASITCQSSTQSASIYEILRKSISLYSCKIVGKIRISIWKTVREIYLVCIVLKCVGPSQSVIASIKPCVFTLKRVLIIINIFSNTMPAEILITLS